MSTARKIVDDEEGEDRRTIRIDMGMTANAITFNGVKFFHGRTYRVKESTARSLMEIMARTKAHDQEILGKEKTENAFRSHNGIVLNKAGAFRG